MTTTLAVCISLLLSPHVPPGGDPRPHELPSAIRLDEWLDPSCLLLPPELPELMIYAALPAIPVCGVCGDVAFVLREAALRDARESYFKAIANCINEGDSFWSCAQDQHQEWIAAQSLVWQQHVQRLQVCSLSGGGGYDPAIAPTTFTANITNPRLPFVVGRTLVYEKQTGEGIERTNVTTLPGTVVIAGVTCRVVHDVVTLGAESVEDTDDWFAQDSAGNVWYFGELARNYEDGQLANVDGSWLTGRDSAKPGVVMKANPSVGAFYRQEMLLGEAEDVAKVVATGQTVVVPHGTYTNCLVTEDWSPLEPGHRERKYYAQGIGLVLSVNLATGVPTQLVAVLTN